MEDWIGILFAVGFIAIKIWSGAKESSDKTAPTTTKPIIDWEDEEEPYMEEKRTEEPRTMSRVEQMLTMLGQPRANQQAPKPKPVAPKPIQKPVNIKPIKPIQSPPKKESPIARELRSAQGARKAFIYSEIFKRKY